MKRNCGHSIALLNKNQNPLLSSKVNKITSLQVDKPLSIQVNKGTNLQGTKWTYQQVHKYTPHRIHKHTKPQVHMFTINIRNLPFPSSNLRPPLRTIVQCILHRTRERFPRSMFCLARYKPVIRSHRNNRTSSADRPIICGPIKSNRSAWRLSTADGKSPRSSGISLMPTTNEKGNSDRTQMNWIFITCPKVPVADLRQEPAGIFLHTQYGRPSSRSCKLAHMFTLLPSAGLHVNMYTSREVR